MSQWIIYDYLLQLLLRISESQNNWGWKGPQEGSVQLTAQRRVCCGVGPGCSGLCLATSWKPKMAQPLRAAWSTAGVFFWRRRFYLYLIYKSSDLHLLFLIFLPCIVVQTLTLSSCGVAAVRCAESRIFPKAEQTSSLSLFWQRSASASC